MIPEKRTWTACRSNVERTLAINIGQIMRRQRQAAASRVRSIEPPGSDSG